MALFGRFKYWLMRVPPVSGVVDERHVDLAQRKPSHSILSCIEDVRAFTMTFSLRRRATRAHCAPQENASFVVWRSR